MNYNDCLNHLNTIQKFVVEIKNDFVAIQKSPDGNKQEKIRLIQKKLDYMNQFASSAKGQVPQICETLGGEPGGMKKLEAIHFILKSSSSLRNWYQSELGVGPGDFSDDNINSSIADQVLNDGISDGVVKQAGANGMYVSAKKK